MCLKSVFVKFTLIFSSLVIIIALGAGCEGVPQDIAEELYEQGELFDIYGHSDLAVQKYRRAIAINPKSIKAHFMLGQAYLAQGRVDLAREQLDKVVELDPSYAKAYIWLGNVDFRSGDVPNALKKWKKAAEVDEKILDKSISEQYRNIGLAYVQEKKHELTNDRWRSNLEFRRGDTKNVDVHGWLGEFYYNRKDYSRAITEWEKVVKNDPGSFSAIQAQANIEETKKIM